MLSASSILNNLPGDKASIRKYVTRDATTALAEGTVALNVTHSNLRQLVQELRFDLHSSIADVKQRLYTFNGSQTGSMELHLKDSSGNLLARMLDEGRPLGYYGAMSGMTIHVIDNDPYSLSRDGGLDNVSRIQKYQMTDEDYDKREKTYRAWKKAQLAKDPHWKPAHLRGPAAGGGGGGGGGGPEPAVDYTDASCVEGFAVGQRCSVAPGDRRGEVAFVGAVEGLAAGFWVGVRLDEPLGKGKGAVDGKVYFEAEEKCGTFVRPERVEVGAHFKPQWEEEVCGDAAGESAGCGGCGEAACGSGGGGGGAEAAPVVAAPASAPAAPAPSAAAKAPPRRRGQIDSDDDEL